jgi:hypothetical protein
MAYNQATFSIANNFVQASIQAINAWGNSTTISPVFKGPPLKEISYGLWPGSGSQLGAIDRVAFPAGTLIDDTPGTTDTIDIDLQALTDPTGATVSLAELVALALFNFSTTAGENLILGGTAAAPATNPWTSPFSAMTTPANGRLTIPPGYTLNGQSFYNPLLISGGGNLAAHAVGDTNKVIRLYTAAPSLSWGMIVVGRSAAS